MDRFASRLLLCVGTIAIACCGCSGDHHVPVSGKLLINGKPFKPEADTNVAINFYAIGGSTYGVGIITETGEYSVSCNGKPGLPPGEYLVTVAITKPSNPKDPYSEPVTLIPPQYADKSQSKIKIQVQPNAAPGSYDLNVSGI